VLIPGAGVDTERFSPVEEPVGEPVILLTARMIRDKGIGELVEASRILKARGCKAHIVLAGMLDNGNPTAISEKEIRGWEQEGLIEWLGPRTDIPLLLANCNIVCLPSYREGLPLSLIEAASAGRAIVTTNVPGCRDIVKDGWNGILVPARNAEALADALQRLLESPEERRRMGINGREKVLAGFTRESVAKETLKVYERVARFVRERENSPS
jgi:glycosyltransferase involved in cell wall biosynthesis